MPSIPHALFGFAILQPPFLPPQLYYYYTVNPENRAAKSLPPSWALPLFLLSILPLRNTMSNRIFFILLGPNWFISFKNCWGLLHWYWSSFIACSLPIWLLENRKSKLQLLLKVNEWWSELFSGELVFRNSLSACLVPFHRFLSSAFQHGLTLLFPQKVPLQFEKSIFMFCTHFPARRIMKESITITSDDLWIVF